MVPTFSIPFSYKVYVTPATSPLTVAGIQQPLPLWHRHGSLGHVMSDHLESSVHYTFYSHILGYPTGYSQHNNPNKW